jgi:putative heme iron utilization protein
MERYINPNSVYIQDGSQEQMILNYIKKYGYITTLEAVKNLGILQCPARIFGLKRRGYNIQTRKRRVENRFGKTRDIVEYYLVEEK